MQIDFIGHGLHKNNKLNVGDQIATSLISPNFDVFIGFVAFTAISGVNKLLKFLLEAKEKNKKVVFFIGVDNKGTSKQSLEILLENKITLAIAIRLRAEEFLISQMPEIDLNSINKNQTNELIQNYKLRNPNHQNLKILDKVNLMTPENIHINAFMYEPLIDMSIHHLKDLYLETSSLN